MMASKISKTGRSISIGHALQRAGSNAVKSGEIGVAALQVIAKRMNLGVAATIDPTNADHAEFGRMLPEKAEAFSQAGLNWVRSSGEIGTHINRVLEVEMVTLAKAMVAMSGCTTTAGVMAIQSRLVADWMTRAFSHSLTLGVLAMKSQSAAMAPIHRTVTGNVRRLGI